MGNTANTYINIFVTANKGDISGIDKANKAINKLRFSMESLNFLFTGMALKKFGESFFKFAFNSWERYESYQGTSIKKTMQLTAAWEFLRFSIFNALGQGDVFVGFVDMLIHAFNWISQFVGKHPELATLVAQFAGLSVILGGASIAGSIIYQLGYGVAKLLEFVGVDFGKLKGNFSDVSSVVGTLAKNLALPVSLYYAYDALKELKEGDYVEAIQSAATSAAGFLWLGGKKGAAGALLGIAAAISIVDMVGDPGKITPAKIIEAAIQAGLTAGVYLTPVVGAAVGITAALVIGEIKWDIGSKIRDFAKKQVDQDTKAMAGYKKGNVPLGTAFVEKVESTAAFSLDLFLGMPLRGLDKLFDKITEWKSKTKEVDEQGNLLNTTLGITDEKIKNVDDSLVGESLVPSIDLLNDELVQSNTENQGLIDKYPSLTTLTDAHTDSVNRLATAYSRLSKAKRGLGEKTSEDSNDLSASANRLTSAFEKLIRMIEQLQSRLSNRNASSVFG